MEIEKKTTCEDPPFVTRRMDNLNRVILPVDARRALDLKPGDTIEFRLKGEGILMRKYEPQKNQLADLAEAFVPVLSEVLHAPVAICDLQHILADAGLFRSFAKMELFTDLIDLIEDRKPGPFLIDPCRIVAGEEQTVSFIAPIVGERNYGAVLLLDNGTMPMKGTLLVLETAAQLLAEQLKTNLETEE